MNRKKQDKAIDTFDHTSNTSTATPENRPENTKDNKRMDTLQKYVSDMIAVEEHIGSAFRRQVNDENLSKHASQASQIITKIAQLTERHEEELKRHLEAIGGDKAKGIKEVATAALGTLAGLYDKVRNEAVSKMLRDDYTALNLATVSYTMLHTTALALNDQATASLALRHLQDYTGVIMEINELIPRIVVTDLRDNGALIEESLLQQAISNTQETWRHHQAAQPVNGDSAKPTTSISSKPRPTTKRSSSENAEPLETAEAAASKPPAAKGAAGAKLGQKASPTTGNDIAAKNSPSSKTPATESVAAGSEPASASSKTTAPKRTGSKRTPAAAKSATPTN